MTPYARIREHQEASWGPVLDELRLARGPMPELDPEFCVHVFAPGAERAHWVYATCGMSGDPERPSLELHMLVDARRDDECLEILTVTAWFHRVREPLCLHHTVWFGRPWIDGSRLAYGLLSIPYLTPGVEVQSGSPEVLHLWLLPITQAERELKMREGVEALEQRLEEAGIDFASPFRASTV